MIGLVVNQRESTMNACASSIWYYFDGHASLLSAVSILLSMEAEIDTLGCVLIENKQKFLFLFDLQQNPGSLVSTLELGDLLEYEPN